VAYTIDRDVCEGIGDCVAVCPTECIAWVDGAVNAKGTRHTRICPACGAPVAALCEYEDVGLLDAKALRRLWQAVARVQSPSLLEHCAIIRGADPEALVKLPTRSLERAMGEYVLQTRPPEGTIGAPERKVAYYLRLLVARGEIVYMQKA
jgi:NAD-dependent dihydropyrimidine dehydrogenase PreA subunit